MLDEFQGFTPGIPIGRLIERIGDDGQNPSGDRIVDDYQSVSQPRRSDSVTLSPIQHIPLPRRERATSRRVALALSLQQHLTLPLLNFHQYTQKGLYCESQI
jgi:hypothetical protein